LQSAAEVLGVVAGETFLVQVAGYQGAGPTGILEVAPFTPPACQLNDDPFEDNDACIQAWSVVEGSYPDLVCRQDDNDFFSIVVQPGRELVVAAMFSDSLADLDLYLWHSLPPGAPCGTATLGVGSANGSLAAALTATDNEVLTYWNLSALPETILIEVDYFSSVTQTCNEYDLALSIMAPALVGAPFCAALPNSTGAPGLMHVTQSPVVQDVTLRVDIAPLPLHSFGFLIMSNVTFAGASVSAGKLCTGPSPLFRFQQALANSGTIGAVSFPFPWQVAPAPILVGETWHFQYWHRDVESGTVVANFSRGLSLLFQ
jgi:hypothetical protein